MIGKKNMAVLVGLVWSVGLLAASLTALFMTEYEKRESVRMMGAVCGKIVGKMPEAEQSVLAALKEYKEYKEYGGRRDYRGRKGQEEVRGEENFLLAYGYGKEDFWQPVGRYGTGLAWAGFASGGMLFLAVLLVWNRKVNMRVKSLTEYLEKVNAGSSGVLFPAGEDECSKLQDEIYKTVTELYRTKDAALEAKNNFAENLYNIAHQMKTPLTAVSLSVQLMKESLQKEMPESASLDVLEQIRRQLSGLTHLEEALLLLSRMDAGTLTLEQGTVDVFTLLMLAADNLQELLAEKNVTAQIPEAGEILIKADMDWTMEAVMNLMKNCMEHTPSGGTVHCRYEENPLYVQIRIWDEGRGFAKEDMPHLFERFYRGKDAGSGGIGIGLALSRTIIERQNGTVTAQNRKEGGACFEIRFYCH